MSVTAPDRGRAVVVTARGARPELVTRPVPSPDAGEALIAVEACGLCGSDRLLLAGGFGNVFPVVPGHEASGRVVGVGDDADTAWVGRRVALYYIDAPEGGTVPGHPNLGAGIRRMGVDVDGALADFVVRPVSTLIPADDLGAVEAALLTDAIGTPFHALELADVQAGHAVAVIGVGGIGSGAVQLAAARGAEVLAVGRRAETGALALSLGAREYRTSDEPAGRLALALGRPLDAVIQCVGDPVADRLAVDIAGIGGTVVLVGASGRPFSVSSTELIWKGLTVKGSRGFTPEDVAAVMAAYRAGTVRLEHLMTRVIALEDAPAALADRDADAGVRIVVSLAAGREGVYR